MCVINIIHFSHPSAPSSAASKLNLPPRLTEPEFLSHQQLPHEFALCPTHINTCCVAYKQTMPCLLWKFHCAVDVGGVNAAACPSLSVTQEHHPLSMLLPEDEMGTTAQDMNASAKGESEPQQPQLHSQNLSEARTTLLSTADSIHTLKLTMDRTIVEASELMELLFLELAEACATTLQDGHHHEPAAKRQAFFSRELEKPLNQCAELCQKIKEADDKICELFQTFLGRRKGLADLVVAAQKTNGDTVLELYGGETYPVGKAREVLRELSVANVAEVCEGSVRRGGELREEMVRLLEGVSEFLQPVL